MRSALILAAGRGERLRPLTDRTPKPLLPAGGKPLIEWQVERLAGAGFDDIVVNHAHLGEQIERALGDGSRFGARIRYSPESPALETAGGIVQALPLLGVRPFVVVSGDIHADFPYASLVPRIEAMARVGGPVAHFVLVPNPPWHAQGDMGLADGRVTREMPWLTYGNIALFQPSIFRGIERGTVLKLFPWMYHHVEAGAVTGERYDGPWDNVGTADQLQALDRRLRA
jgi:MurNAc alpha-1-phosphate uridylyltransferase